ncbi:[protein-PII] uridylyltransferase [Notoacmeibacter sp. MSK16QG-6]|uniref:[protein-PII] uridylyltransferase n=1 Tax=Notoacmeibacter sp. MSK16QG-6 TaxID=2957982 RepID=UPI00209D0EF1|nr:[protein-PII] uridylyltransferase [Notoacmeibacter sp. MSK16QG-6]MCP1198914.1 [protein-PII] uridylyltransferase [Notoacmeibacter sp. MSK16QG-6]
MRHPALKLAEVIDADALRDKLTTLTQERDGDGSDPSIRTQVLAILKAELAAGRKRIETMLLEDGSGFCCTRRLSHQMDEIIRLIHDFAITHVYRGANLSAGEKMAIVATGGYGRDALAPGSDIDLLFLLPHKQTARIEQIVEYMLYILWDLGLKVGHATRNINECIRLAKSDVTISTAMLEARYIWGERPLFETLEERFVEDVEKAGGRDFTTAKMAERDSRHERHDNSRYKVEPNIKDGKGGLRDLQTLYWIGKFVYRVDHSRDLVGKGVFTQREYNQFQRCDDFLWAVRCHLHFVSGKAEDRLGFDFQPEIAARLDYQSKPGLSGVERFMKHYFIVAKQVGDLTRIFCAALELEQAKTAPGIAAGLVRPFTRRKKNVKGFSDFVIENGRLNVAAADVFERDNLNLIRLFWLGDREGLEYHPDALSLVARSLKLVDRDLRRNSEGNEMFMDILTSRRDPEIQLRRMNETGLLGRLIQDFRKVVAMMQFNMYHHFTVDEHLLRCISNLFEIEKGNLADEHPYATQFCKDLSETQRRILYVALLLHDIAKGRPEDHSIAGAKIAKRLCPHMGMTKSETATVEWLVREHLTMSMVAQSRDLNDRKTIADFAETVQSVDRLKLLVILTVCDIRGVGPGVWNAWKGQLIRQLYTETELLLTGGFSGASRAARIQAARESLKESLSEWPKKDRQAYAELHYPAYLLAVDHKAQLRHAEFIRKATKAGEQLALDYRTLAFEGMTEITVLAFDHPRLLSVIAAACAASGANIVDAQIFTTTDGRALDTIRIAREFEADEDELRRARSIGRTIAEVLKGDAHIPQLKKRSKSRRKVRAFSIQPEVSVDNSLSNEFSVIAVEGLDRTGLLSDLTHALSDLSLDIASAHITTFGERVVDTFYVTDLTGAQIESPARQKRITDRLCGILAPEQTEQAAA